MTMYIRSIVITFIALTFFCILPLTSNAEEVASEAEAKNLILASAKKLSPISAKKVYAGKEITLDVVNMDISDVINIISVLSGREIVIADAIKGKMTASFKNMPWDKALDAILNSHDLWFDKVDGVLTIYNLSCLSSLHYLKTKKSVTELDAREAQTDSWQLLKRKFTPRFVTIDMMSKTLTELKSNRGQLAVSGNDIYVEDEPRAVCTMAREFMRLEYPPVSPTRRILFEVYIANYSSAFLKELGFSEDSGLWGEAKSLALGDTIHNAPAETNNPNLKTIILDEAAARVFDRPRKTVSSYGCESKSGSKLQLLSEPRITITEDSQPVFIKLVKRKDCPPETSPATQLQDVNMSLKIIPDFNEDNQTVSLNITLYDGDASNIAEPHPDIKSATTTLVTNEGRTAIAIGGVDGGEQKYEDAASTGRTLRLADWISNGRASRDEAQLETVIFITSYLIPGHIDPAIKSRNLVTLN